MKNYCNICRNPIPKDAKLGDVINIRRAYSELTFCYCCFRDAAGDDFVPHWLSREYAADSPYKPIPSNIHTLEDLKDYVELCIPEIYFQYYYQHGNIDTQVLERIVEEDLQKRIAWGIKVSVYIERHQLNVGYQGSVAYSGIQSHSIPFFLNKGPVF